jgi:catechol 2,3-dioxygenase-like lactoylglutathione lyase family enzyme
MIDHVSIGVGDIARTKAFYDAVLKPLGYACLSESEGTPGYGMDHAQLWTNLAERPVKPDMESGLYFCLSAPTRQSVDAFHKAALANGGRDNGKPGLRADYGEGYYAAFVIDPDPPRPLEAETLEGRQGAVEQKGWRGFPTLDIIGVSHNAPAAESPDLFEGALQRGGCDAGAAIALAREEAGDAPVGQRRIAGGIGALIVQSRQFRGRAELAPADALRAVEDQRGMRAPFANAALLRVAPGRRRVFHTIVLPVAPHATAAAPDAVVRVDQAREVRPCVRIKRLGLV